MSKKKRKHAEKNNHQNDGSKEKNQNVIYGIMGVQLILLLVLVLQVSAINTNLAVLNSKIGNSINSPIQANSGNSGNSKQGMPAGTVNDNPLIGNDAVKGDPNAPVTIIEWSDYECPFCARFAKETLPLIQKNYIDTGKAKLVFKDFPLSFHQNAQKAAEAAECAGEQGLYYEMHNKLFGSGVEGGVATFKKYARELNLDTSQFDSCIDSGKYVQEIKDDISQGQANGIRGTPGFLINGVLISGAQPYENFKAAIEAALTGKEPAPEPETTPEPNPAAEVNMETLSDNDPYIGSPDAPVTMVEWSDYQCPYCSRFYSETMPTIKEKYIDTGKVKFVYRDYPLSFHENAQKAAEAAECAGEQNKYWEMHDMLFESGVSGGVETFKGYATDIGLDAEKFNDCLDTGKYEQEVKDDMAAGSAAGIRGTPGFVINDVLVSGAQPYENFEQVIEKALAS